MGIEAAPPSRQSVLAPLTMSYLFLGSWCAWGVVVLAAALFRSRIYATFRGVTLGLHTLIAVALLPREGLLGALSLFLHVTVYLESLLLIRPALRPLWYRLVISWPAQYFAASVLLALPWAVAKALGFEPHGVWLPFLLGTIGLVQSLSSRTESRTLVVGNVPRLGSIRRVEAHSSPEIDHGAQRPLRIVQITDPHLGPWMPVSRLKKICERAVAQDPDLVLLTGDFLTMESQGDERHLAEAFSPFQKLEGRVFSCLGNHDHEALRVVEGALAAAGVRLLVDEATVARTAAGDVQILGFDFHFRDRASRMRATCQNHPRLPGVPRLALLHDPGAFKHLPDGEADLVLSGHTHGGQVGLVSLGLLWTVAGWVAKIPDHGFWGRGTDRLYVHRGTGHYGFPLRLGVPAEESLLLVYVAG